jgi:hypothetical protein
MTIKIMDMAKALISATLLLLLISRAFGQVTTEKIQIVWPEEYKWKVGSDMESGYIRVLTLVPANEEIGKWTIYVEMMKIWGAKDVPMDSVMTRMFNTAKRNAPKATVQIIEKNEDVENASIIFKIEAARLHNSKKPQSQLYYVVQGESSLFSNLVAIKEKTLPEPFIEKWKVIFKTSRLIWE